MRSIIDYRRRSLWFAFVLFAGVLPAAATTHIVKFGGSAGLKYVPATLSVVVGDTITWEGDFSVHPLSSTTIPATSQSWHVATGTSFSYGIAVPGTYHYRCDVHSGMTGTFETATTEIGTLHPGTTEDLMHLRVVSTSQNPSVQFTAPHAGVAVVRITDLQGRVQTTMSIQVGQQRTCSLPFTRMAANGICTVSVVFDNSEASCLLTQVH